MKGHLSVLALVVLCSTAAFAQTGHKIENVIIITTDGFRWQEVFTGMDSSLASDTRFNQNDSAAIFKKYWSPSASERRKKLLPFIWGTMAAQGQIYGNRLLDVKVNNANPYWFSYPGYNEIFCGFVDTTINTNSYPANPHTNLLEFLNKEKGYTGKVGAFCAWDAFSKILNGQRSGLPIVCGYEPCGGVNPDTEEDMINLLKKDAYSPFGDAEAQDVFTHYAAMDYLKKKQPRAMYISYGETDEWAHKAHYKDYLDAANRADNWLADIWNYIQSSPHYKDKTLLFISVDHGRGLADKWTSHNNKIPNSNEIWFGIMGPGIAPKGEINTNVQLYQQQYAQTIAQLLGFTFICEHPVADGFKELLVK